MTYQNRNTWMTTKLRTQISEKNILGLDAFRNPADLHLKNEYKQKRNRLISDLRNAEIDCYSNELDVNQNDVIKIGKNSNESKNNMTFTSILV